MEQKKWALILGHAFHSADPTEEKYYWTEVIDKSPN